jgi:hypothetical protein
MRVIVGMKGIARIDCFCVAVGVVREVCWSFECTFYSLDTNVE